MAWKTLKATLVGIGSGMIHHNGALADELNPIVVEMKKINAKKQNKTDADRVRLAQLEFMGGLWLDEKDEPCVPAAAVEKMLRDAASRDRKGRTIDAGIRVSVDSFPLKYKGPRSAEKLWGSGHEKNPFVFRVGAAVNKARIIRTRPIFREWSMDIEIEFDPHAINEKDLRVYVERAGDVIGLGDWRPGSPKGGKHGRFEVKFT